MKKKLFSICLAAVILLQTVVTMSLYASAWSWTSDGRCAVPTYNAQIVEDESIEVDAKLDVEYVGGTKITSYPDAEPYRRGKYESVWANARGTYEA